jgi:hypothetical protein
VTVHEESQEHMTGLVQEPTLSAVIHLLAEYVRRMDARDTRAWSELFLPDGVLALADREVVGRPDLQAFAEASSVGVHLNGLPSVGRVERGGVAVTSNYVFLDPDTRRVLMGTYVDWMVLHESGLLFGRREVTSRGRLAV